MVLTHVGVEHRHHTNTHGYIQSNPFSYSMTNVYMLVSCQQHMQLIEYAQSITSHMISNQIK